jgi:hypothetical protein
MSIKTKLKIKPINFHPQLTKFQSQFMTEQNKFGELSDSVKAYVNTTYELTVLKAIEKAANVGSEAISALLILKILSLAVFILTFAVAFYIASVMDGTYWGFLIVGGAYLVIALLLQAGRNSLLKKSFRNMIIKALFKQHQ